MIKQNSNLIIVGAGLAGGLLAFYIKERRPDLRVLLLEKASEIAKHKTWSFHRSDLADDDFATLAPFISKSWPGYDVSFKHYSRTLSTEYCSIRPEDFEAKLREVLGADLQFDTEIRSFDSRSVVLSSGEILTADVVIDARGMNPSSLETSGFQKFVGVHLKFENPHGLTRPILMDATVEQIGGFRFIYVLPWSSTEALIEDTYYGDSENLDFDSCVRLIKDYAENKGWKIKSVMSQESGKLPIPLWRPERISKDALKIGVSAGYFHAVTGYSVPNAVSIAARISKLSTLNTQTVAELLDNYHQEQSKSWSFFCLLNRMMFLAATPQNRFKVFERFYKFRQPLVERFYAGQLRLLDMVQILSGRPPVPVIKAAQSAFARPDHATSKKSQEASA